MPLIKRQKPLESGDLSARRPPHVLYLVYWGAAEPLGQSLVVPAVQRLASLGADLTLVTFEKPADLDRREEISRIRVMLNDCGVRWIPLRYHKRPKVPATAFDILNGWGRGIVTSLRFRPDIIHTRTFVGGLIGMSIAPILGTKLIYHNEGFYPDEQVDAGVWKRNSAPHRVARYLERKMYLRADGIIALSNKAKDVIGRLWGVSNRKPVIVVPSCVDLNHFRFNPATRPAANGTLTFVYAGSVGGRYSLAKIGRFVGVASRCSKRTHLRVLTRSEPDLAASMLQDSGLSDDAWSIDAVPYRNMPEELARQQVGLHFLPQGTSDHGGSPTKIGEYWAAGLPVVVTPGAGDTDEIIKRERVGVIVKEHSDAEYEMATRELQSLLEDDELSARCRRAAEIHYALDPACERQFRLYEELVSRGARATAGARASELGNS